MGCRSLAVGLISIFGVPAATAAAPEFTPLKLKSFDRESAVCRTIAAGDPNRPNHVTVEFRIGANGDVEDSNLAKDLPEWQQQLAQCALKAAVFEPELRNGAPTATKAQLVVEFAPYEGGLPDEVQLAGIRDLITAPRMRPNAGSVFSKCLSHTAPANVAWRFVISATVGRDGHIKTTKLPPAAPPWMLQTLQCVEKDMKLWPGTHDGEAVEAEVSFPFHLVQDGSGPDFEAAKPPKDRDLIEAAYRACYPADQLAIGSVLFTFDVTIDGNVRNAKLVRGSGDPVLDKAAACILPRLRFEPTMRNGRPIQSSISWELPVRPPH